MKKKTKLNIKSALKRPGALTRKAKKAKMSPMAFAAKHKGSSGLTGEQSRFALMLKRVRTH